MSHDFSPQPIGSRTVPPDPSITSAIGRHHTLPTAVTDLVDNSIDAGATQVLVRFLLRGVHPVGLMVIDDAEGMDSAAIDDAMTYAKKRVYGGSELGHFGIGLKAASLSQARSLVVWSKCYGSPAVGRRLRRETIDTGPVVEEFSTTDAAERLASAGVDFPLETGTIVEWQDVQTFLTSSSVTDQKEWVSTKTQELIEHLGLVLHRILERGELTLRVENYDVDERTSGIPRSVQPIDPFRYRGVWDRNYPKELPVTIGDAIAYAHLHLRPDLDHLAGPRDSQGLYVYRNERLLQTGGWNGLASESADLSFARVAIDLGDEFESHVTINPEKAGTTFDDELRYAFDHARADDGTTLASFRRDAKAAAKLAKQRAASPVEAPLPGEGLPAGVVGAFDEHTEPNTTLPIDIKWRVLPEEVVYQIEGDEQCLFLNALYREAIVGRRSLDIDDAPFVKSLLLLLLRAHFVGSGRGAKKKREDAAWQAILLSAIKDQSAQPRRIAIDHDVERRTDTGNPGAILRQWNRYDPSRQRLP